MLARCDAALIIGDNALLIATRRVKDVEKIDLGRDVDDADRVCRSSTRSGRGGRTS